MKAITPVIILLISQAANAYCWAEYYQALLLIQVRTCQNITIDSDNRSGFHAHQPNTSFSGTLVSGRVIKHTAVSTRELASNHRLKKSDIAEGGYITLLVNSDADEYCPTIEIGESREFITRQICCDVLPTAGACLVPGGFIQVEADPETDILYRYENSE